MNERAVLAIIAIIVLGAAAISSTESIPIEFKTVFYGVGMGILLIIGLISFFQFIKRGREKRMEEKKLMKEKKQNKKNMKKSAR
ncbi:hypothetical protein [Planomicrobium sp. YIM 101495]|uniref:hypothetical protein n=1 Tax=Planomicrobium sp. YIM 101495 TaxID=2665160 RepID=UPI0012B750BD|nr:hypothetical protein [Planomicrobium sp. YIM 101495]MTD31701.1 hypothetical protein [Planomicrobium sp. YIM 101495]